MGRCDVLQVLPGAGLNALNSPAPHIQAQSESQQRQLAAVEAEHEPGSGCCVGVFMLEGTGAL